MTQKTVDRSDAERPKKMDGWFSWRHKTREAHDAARERYLSEHGPAARRRKAAARENPAATPTRALTTEAGL